MFNVESENFINLCAKGELLLDDIDDAIDDWHDSDSDLEIYDYLGMTQQEYRMWLHDPDILPFIITARTHGLSIDDVMEDIHDLPMAARADSPAKARFLMKWLKNTGL